MFTFVMGTKFRIPSDDSSIQSLCKRWCTVITVPAKSFCKSIIFCIYLSYLFCPFGQCMQICMANCALIHTVHLNFHILLTFRKVKIMSWKHFDIFLLAFSALQPLGFLSQLLRGTHGCWVLQSGIVIPKATFSPA